MMSSALMLLAATTVIAWHQDAAREQLLSKPQSRESALVSPRS